MGDSLAGQMQVFCAMFLVGTVLALLFDLLRAARLALEAQGCLASLGDLAFWVVATLVVFGSLMLVNWGEMRLYTLLGLACGTGGYYVLASPLVLPGLLRLARGIRRLGRRVRRAASRPLSWCHRVIRRTVAPFRHHPPPPPGDE